MTSLIRRFLGRRFDGDDTTHKRPPDDSKDQLLVEEEEDAQASEAPYIASSIYYLIVILFIGLPVWFYTCSSNRYSLPNLQKLENKLSHTHPRLHLDISVVQLAATTTNHHHQQINSHSKSQQTDNYLRANLPDHLDTSMDNVTYNLSWRIRRPTIEESQLMKALMRENENSVGAPLETTRQETFERLEKTLLEIHKPANRFRIFMFLFQEPLNSLVCDKPQSYSINFERFVYLCPGEGDESLAQLIQSALSELYFDTVDPKRIKKILAGKTDLLVSLVPEKQSVESVENLSTLSKLIHRIYDKNVKSRYLELAEVLNVRLITQNVIDLLDGKTTDKMLKKWPAGKAANETLARTLDINGISQFYHKLESRLNRHSAQSVHHVLAIVPDKTKPPLVLESASGDKSGIGLLEERDSNFVLMSGCDKSLVLGLRAIIRRVIGLRSGNLCKSCQIRRDVFINMWEFDSIVGAMTIMKLQSIYISLRSLSRQAIGIKIPRYVSSAALEAHDSALKSIDYLEARKPLEAYRVASSAFEVSEAAFYDPSLLETLYFPDETKYAIYLPLFLPLAFPFVMSIFRIFKYYLMS